MLTLPGFESAQLAKAFLSPLQLLRAAIVWLEVGWSAYLFARRPQSADRNERDEKLFRTFYQWPAAAAAVEDDVDDDYYYCCCCCCGCSCSCCADEK